MAELEILFSLSPFNSAERKPSKFKKGEKLKLKVEQINPRRGLLYLREVK